MSAKGRSPALGPVAQRPPDHDQLSQVVGVVIGDEQGFAEDRLSVPVGDAGEQVGGRIVHQFLHRLQVVVLIGQGVRQLVGDDGLVFLLIEAAGLSQQAFDQ